VTARRCGLARGHAHDQGRDLEGENRLATIDTAEMGGVMEAEAGAGKENARATASEIEKEKGTEIGEGAEAGNQRGAAAGTELMPAPREGSLLDSLFDVKIVCIVLSTRLLTLFVLATADRPDAIRMSGVVWTTTAPMAVTRMAVAAVLPAPRHGSNSTTSTSLRSL